MLQNKEDIADFVIYSGNNDADEKSQKMVPYNLRSQTLKNSFTQVKLKFN